MMSNLAYKLDEEYTYEDYLQWGEDARYEIIDGIACKMPSPSVIHQSVSGEITGLIWEFLKDKPCRVFAAPFDVRLFPEEDNSDTTVVQPDILVVCDPSKLSDGKACRGAPDLVIEILSDSSMITDRKVKAEKYRQAGVKEYWIVDAGGPIVSVNLLEDGQYVSTIYKDYVPSTVLPGLKIDLKAVKASVYA
jgi:Uma2 family endonuclease